MRLHPMFFAAALCLPSVAQAHKPVHIDGAVHDFNSLIGHWQCTAKQMHIGLDQFELEYMDASLALAFERDMQSSNITSRMQATSLTHEPMFSASSLIIFDAQREGFVQYERTVDGAEATLYTPGFVGPCVTWHYAPEAASAELASQRDFGVQARFCMDTESKQLNIDYTLRLVDHEPLVLMMAQCERQDT